MAAKIVVCYFLLLLVSDSFAAPFKLHLQDSITVWEPQESFFQLNWEDYFDSKGGIYHFAFDTGNSRQQSFRSEKRLPDGTVAGFYGFVDPEGALRITEYIAGYEGYRQRTIIRNPFF